MLFRFLHFIDTSIRLRSLKWKRLLEESYNFERFSEEERELINLSQLNLLISKVTNHNEFYRSHLKRFKFPLEKTDEIKKLPVLRKNDVLLNYQSMISNLKTRFKSGSTSGSTGVPLKFLVDHAAVVKQTLSYYRFLNWYGIQPYSKHILLWGPYKAKSNNLIKRIKTAIYKNQYRINVFNLNTESFIIYYKKIKSFKPVYFRSYKSGAIQFAEIAGKLKIDLKELKLKLVVVTSEVLLPDERAFIEKSYGCLVGNEYGASEIGQFAFDCPMGNLHINDDVNYLYVDGNNNVYVTSLYNVKFPFINYEIGDQIEISEKKCSCGRTMPLIERVNGRVNDYILKSNGEHLSQYAFYYLFDRISKVYGSSSVKRYKIIQQREKFYFEIVKGPVFPEEITEYISKYVSENIWDKCQVFFSFVEEIQREPNGKLRFFQRINQ